jgi:hypothetical protein
MKNAYISVGRAEEKRSFWRSRDKWGESYSKSSINWIGGFNVD